MVLKSVRMLLNLVIASCLLIPGSAVMARQSSTTDIRIWSESPEHGPVYDVCYQLHTANGPWSNVGCDENRDGNVYFQDVPYGNYDVVATNAAERGYDIQPMGIRVDAENTDFLVFVVKSAPEAIETTDVHLITRDPDTGEVIYDACYELVGYSNIGCDENRDGHITFADIPLSTYTIRQTTTPAGYERMGDYTISIMPTDADGPFVVLLSQSETQAPDNDHNNISIVFYDAWTNQRLEDPENCAQLFIGRESKSLLGCDEDVVDSQVDFMHAPFDPQDDNATVRVGTMCGYQIVDDQPFQLLWVGQHSAINFVALEPTDEFCI